MDYSIDHETIRKDMLMDQARDAIKQHVLAETHHDQFTALSRHRNQSIKDVATTVLPDHKKNAKSKAAMRKRRMERTDMTTTEVKDIEIAVLTEFIERNEREHLSNTVMVEELKSARDNDEVTASDIVEQVSTPQGPQPLSLEDAIAFHQGNADICEAAVAAARAKLDRLRPKPRKGAKAE